jgi:adenylosuccinate lyase
MMQDLHDHAEFISEALQNYLRTRGNLDGYDKTKKFFRGVKRSRQEITKFIQSLKLPKTDEERLLELKPETYLGYAQEIVEQQAK